MVTSGVESYDVDIMEQKVTVKGNVTPDAVLQTVSKTGKKTSFWEAEAVTSESATPAGATAWQVRWSGSARQGGKEKNVNVFSLDLLQIIANC